MGKKTLIFFTEEFCKEILMLVLPPLGSGV